MSHARYFVALRAGYYRCDMATAFLNVGEIEVPPYHKGWHRDLAESVEEGLNVNVRSKRWGAERDAVHIKKEIASGTCYATFGCQWPVKPETRLHCIQPIEFARCLGLFRLHHQFRDFGRVDRIGGAYDIRGNQNKGANARRVSDGGIKRDAASKGAADEDCGVSVCGSLQYCHEIRKGGKVLRLDASLAEPASVISDCFVDATDSIQLGAPHPPVAHVGMKKYGGNPGAHDLCGKSGETRCDVLHKL